MNRSTAHPFISVAAMLAILALSFGLDRWIIFLRDENARTADYAQLALTSYSLAHLLLAVLLLALFAWMVLRVYKGNCAAWIFLLVGLFISVYPAVYFFTPVWRLLSWKLANGVLVSWELANIMGPGSFFLTAGSFIAVTGAAALLRNRRWKAGNFNLLVFLPILLLSACISPASLTPETAAIGFLSTEHQPYGLKSIDPLSIEVLHKQPFKEHVMLLITFRSKGSASSGVYCTALLDSFQNTNRTWSAIGVGGGSCRPVEDARMPHFNGAGIASSAEPEDPPFYSYVFEELWSDNIQTASITWEDELTQDVSLNKNIYLVVREGQFTHTLVEGKNKTGQVVYSRTHTPSP